MKTELFNVFTEKQIQAIKDCVRYGIWGDTPESFWNENGERQEYSAIGCCTNDIHKSKRYPNKRSISGIVSGISRKVDSEKLTFISFCPDWWGDGTGDMMFFNLDVLDTDWDELVDWAKE